jgi:TonB-dependent starch-binding outer membrane protein SusC
MIRLFTKAIKCVLVLLLVANIGWAQGKNVTGKVTSSDDGAPIPGVNILEKGTTNGSVTDGDGGFKISVGTNATLVFSFVGYAPQEVVVGSQAAINVVLQTDVTSLQEIVVIGYGQQEKKDVTGAIVSVASKDFNKGVLSSPQDLFTGRVAGVSVISNSGAPGAGSQIRIRGGSSLSASNDPLIVIDGFPVDNNELKGSANPLATLNPSDIETFTVLKDASATAIYGSRASNGVIIITTKKGKEDGFKLNYNGNLSIASPIKYVDVLTADEYRQMVTGLKDRNFSGIDQNVVNRLGTSNTDWQKEIFRTAVSHDHNIGAEGKWKNLPYRISYGYTDQQGVLNKSVMKRNSINVNLNPSFFDGKLNVTAGFKGSITDNNYSTEGAIGAAVSYDPTQPVYDATSPYGGFFYTKNSSGSPITIGSSNPVSLIEQKDNKSAVTRSIGTLQIDYAIPFVPGLKANINSGFDISTSDGREYDARDAAWSFTGPGNKRDYAAKNISSLFDFYLYYKKQLGRHSLDASAGYSYQHFERKYEEFSRNWDETVFGNYQLNAEGNRVARQDPKSINTLISHFGRINYNYDDRFLVTATLRNDLSSRFSKDTRSGLFPSVALGWRLINEDFMKAFTKMSDLKLRVGYGVTGQQDISTSSYPYLPTYTRSTATAQYQLGDVFYTTYRSNGYDANIKWEQTATYNAGIDVGLFQNKLMFTADYYFRQTKDLINTIPVAMGSNLTNFLTTNVGDMEGRGVEITLTGKPIDKKDFTVQTGVNFTYNFNQITKLTKVDDPDYEGVPTGDISGGTGNKIQNHQVGYAPSSFYVYQQVYDRQGKPIEGLYVDRNGDGETNSKDLYHYQKPAADVLIGVNSSVTYKQFDFSFSGRISLGNYVYNNVNSANNFYGNVYNSAGFFTNLNQDINNTNFRSARYLSDYYVQNASFFKMDFISTGYNFTKLFTEKLRGRIGFTVRNAFIITNYTGLDPELNNGIDNNLYPRPRTFVFNLTLTY